MLRLILTGGVFLSADGQEIPLPNRKARAMLALLALSEPPELPRERLTGLLWSESEQSRANATLRQAVHEARAALIASGCDVLRAARLTLGLHPGSFQVDVTETLAALDALDAGPAPRVAHLAETLFGGFEDLDPAFYEWLMTWRATVQTRLVRALERGFRDPRQPRANRRALAESVLALDPTHEEACRTVMRCAAEDGEIGAALRAYDTLYRLLDTDFDMEPSAVTQELVAEIKQGKYDNTLSSVAGATPVALPVLFAEPARSGPPWIAVMPFRALGPDPLPPYVAEGFVEDIVCMLAGLREPVVISSSSTRMFQSDGTDLRRAEQELGVQYVLTGSTRSAGRALRLSVELSDVSSGVVHWARAFDASEDMLFDAQDRIVAQIVNTLAPRVHEAELRRIRIDRPKDLSAYHLTLEARDLIFRLEQDAFEQAGQLLLRAIALEPSYASAHAALAGWYSLRLGQGWSADAADDTRALNRAADAAVRLDGGNARALALLGNSKTIYEHNYTEAVLLSERALDAAPNDAEVWLWSGPTRAYMGDADEAVQRVERALRLSPRDPLIFRTYHFLCVAHYARGDYAEAAHWGNLSYRANPRYTANLRLTAASLVVLGRMEEARQLAVRAMQVEPGFRANSMLRRFPFRDVGRRAEYIRQLLDAGLPA